MLLFGKGIPLVKVVQKVLQIEILETELADLR